MHSPVTLRLPAVVEGVLTDAGRLGGSSYHLLSMAELVGSFDQERLQEALRLTVARTAALRTVFFRTAAGGWASRVASSGTTPVVRRTVQARSGEPALDVVQRLVGPAGRQVLDATRGPTAQLTMIAVMRDDVTERFVSLLVHQATMGREAVTAFWMTLAEMYRLLDDGCAAAGTAAGVAQETVEQAPSDVIAAARAAQLAGAPTVIELPSDLTRPPMQDPAGTRLAFRLSDRADTACARLARECSVDRTTVLLAAWSVVLARRAGVAQLLLGHTRAGPRPLPVLCVLTDATSVREYVGQVASAVAEAEQARGVGVDELRALLDVGDDPRWASLLQFALDVSAADMPVRILAGDLELGLHEGDCGSSPFDASLVLRRWEHTAELELEFATSVLLPSEAAALVDSIDATLPELLECLDERLETVRTISGTQASRLAFVRDGPPCDSSDDLWRLVADIAREWPDAEAVSGLDVSRPLSYVELVAAVERLAVALAAVGVGPDAHVLIAHARSVKEIVSVLAVLRCGGTYVAFDANTPDERLKRMFSAASPNAIVGDPGMVERISQLCPSPCPVVIAPDPCEARGAGLVGPPLPAVDPDRPAYITFTSGSTGTPKAVRIPHRGVVRLVRRPAHVRCGVGERMLRFAPLAFDASTLELFAPLANGGCVVVLPQELQSPAELAELIEASGITVLWLTAGLFRLMVDLAPHAFAGVRQVLTGGDVVPPEQARRLLERFPGLRVTCGYGPTENTTFSTVHDLNDPSEVESPLPIGRPISGTGLLILDDSGRQVPPGSVGEVCVTGAGLAIDYLGTPTQTFDAFGLPAPDTGERMYRTGDLARLDGRDLVRFLGRSDDQVKVRGFRIETQEIVTRLLEHPAVSDAVVVAVGADASSRRLLAGVVARAEPRLDVQLKAHLALFLPGHAVPALWAFVDRLPVTANGKVDTGELERTSARFLAERRRR